MSGVNISICDGKYTVIQAPTGTTRVLRYGEEWRDVTGDNVIGGLAWELQEARDRIKRLEAVVNDPHALWTNWLRGDVKLPVGIGDVRQYQDCIKRLEEAGDKLHWAWMNPFDPAGETIVDNWRKAKEAKL